MIDIDDYRTALERFMTVASRLDGRLRSILLYGSMVKGTLRPGASDMLDAVVILRDSVLTSEAEYCEVLDALTEACARIQNCGAPFHPVHYFVMNEAGWSATAHFLPAWKSERYSRVIAGIDVRASLSTTDAECEFMRGWYIQLYWALQQAALAAKLGPRPGGRSKQSAGDLLRMLRDIPQFACLACGVLVDRDEAPAAIVRLFPDADIGLLSQLCDPFAASMRDRDETVLVEQILAVNDELYRAVSRVGEGHRAVLAAGRSDSAM